MTELPDKSSALIRLALADLVKCERSKKYKIDMETWHTPNSQCAVCLGGAVMAQTFGKGSGYIGSPTDFPWNTGDKFYALNLFRQGNCDQAFGWLSLERYAGQKFNRNIVEYDDDPTAFKRDMRKLAADLEEAGY